VPKKGLMNDVSASGPKLMTRGRYVLGTAAVIVGASLQPIREYRTGGIISRATVISAAIAFCLGLALVLVVGWWANRPERGDSDE
jgi:hypothetical protein